jgi:hypothetical protein
VSAHEEFWSKYDLAQDRGRYDEADRLSNVWDKAYDVLAEREPVMELTSNEATWNEARAKVALELLSKGS